MIRHVKEVTFPQHKVNPKLQNGREVSINFLTIIDNDMYIYINKAELHRLNGNNIVLLYFSKNCEIPENEMHILSLDGSGPFGYMQLFLLNDIMNMTTMILRNPKRFLKIISR